MKIIFRIISLGIREAKDYTDKECKEGKTPNESINESQSSSYPFYSNSEYSTATELNKLLIDNSIYHIHENRTEQDLSPRNVSWYIKSHEYIPDIMMSSAIGAAEEFGLIEALESCSISTIIDKGDWKGNNIDKGDWKGTTMGTEGYSYSTIDKEEYKDATTEKKNFENLIIKEKFNGSSIDNDIYKGTAIDKENFKDTLIDEKDCRDSTILNKDDDDKDTTNNGVQNGETNTESIYETAGFTESLGNHIHENMTEQNLSPHNVSWYIKSHEYIADMMISSNIKAADEYRLIEALESCSISTIIDKGDWKDTTINTEDYSNSVIDAEKCKDNTTEKYYEDVIIDKEISNGSIIDNDIYKDASIDKENQKDIIIDEEDCTDSNIFNKDDIDKTILVTTNNVVQNGEINMESIYKTAGFIENLVLYPDIVIGNDKTSKTCFSIVI